MLKERARLVVALLFLADLSAVIVAFFTAYKLRNVLLAPWRPPIDLVDHLRVLLLATLNFAFFLHYVGLYQSFRLRTVRSEILLVFRACFLAILSVGVLVFALKYQFVSRPFLAFLGAVAFVTLSLERWTARLIAHSVRSRGHNIRNVIIIGTGNLARHLAQTIEKQAHWGIRILGHVGKGKAVDPRMRILGPLEVIPQLTNGSIVDQVIVALPLEELPKAKQAFLYCQQVGIPVLVCADEFSTLITRWTPKLEELSGMTFLAFPSIPHSELELYLKRLFDILGATVLLIFFSPFLLVAAILMKLTSPGPILFRQARVGLHGRLFTLYKLRTMILGAEEIKKHLLPHNEADGPVFKIRDDPRITPVGRWLRRTSLDEVPQLFNVLRGEMSIVGPRPPLPEELARYEPWQRRRLSVKPGLTCLWQVSGRRHLDFQSWMQLDLNYVDNWSWWLDLNILLRTIPAMLKGQ